MPIWKRLVSRLVFRNFRSCNEPWFKGGVPLPQSDLVKRISLESNSSNEFGSQIQQEHSFSSQAKQISTKIFAN